MALSEYWKKAVFQRENRERVDRITERIWSRTLQQGFESAIRHAVNDGGKKHIDGLLEALDPNASVRRFDRWCCLLLLCYLKKQNQLSFALVLHQAKLLDYRGLRRALLVVFWEVVTFREPTPEVWQRIEEMSALSAAA